jgi:hypothetical protein
VVENTLHQRSKSSTFDVARNNLSSSRFSALPLDADGGASLSLEARPGIGRTPDAARKNRLLLGVTSQHPVRGSMTSVIRRATDDEDFVG